MEVPRARPAPVAPPEGAALRTLVLSDLVGSTGLVEELGDARAAELFGRHDRAARDLLRAHGGLEIDKTDGFLLLFELPWDAVRFALAYHRALEDLSLAEDLELTARVGIHLGEVILRRNRPEQVARGAKPLEVEGLAKPTAARLMSLAGGRQTLVTRGVFDVAQRSAVGDAAKVEGLTWLAHGGYLFKGVLEPVEVFEVGEAGFAPLAAPEGSAKVKRAEASGEILGWRPAPGQRIPQRRHWVVERKLGEGGFGEVWLAAHVKTRDRRVFKFCYEASRLAALQREITLFRLLKEELGQRDDIARILDWSFEEPPYFIESEYAAAGDLMRWVEEQGGLEAVALETRLEIVAQVATALAAAHSVGVLHKDVKPTNILITTDREGGPRARLTDFGIGAVVERERLATAGFTVLGLTEPAEPTAATQTGTRLYMAPEVVEGKAGTLQADVYALGVLLYQMVVGDLSRALAPGWRRDVEDELLREDIAEAVDGSPERRLGDASRLAERLRSLDHRRRQRQARQRELEESERAKTELARARKRRRSLLLATALCATVAAVTLVQAWRIDRERQRADLEAEAARQVSQFLVELFEVSDPVGDPLNARGETITAREILDHGAERLERELGDQPAVRARLMNTIGEVYLTLGLYEAARPLLESALATRRELHGDEHPEVAASLHGLATLLSNQADYEAAEPLLREALALRRELLGEEHRDVAVSRNNLAQVLQKQGNYEAAEPLYREDLALRKKLLGDDHPWVATSLSNLAFVLQARGDLEAAEALQRQGLEIRRQALGDRHIDVALSMNHLAVVHLAKGDHGDAERLLRQAEAIDRQLGEHPELATILSNLALSLYHQGAYQAAEPVFDEALAMRRKLLGDRHPYTADTWRNVVALYETWGKPEKVAEIRAAMAESGEAAPEGGADR